MGLKEAHVGSEVNNPLAMETQGTEAMEMTAALVYGPSNSHSQQQCPCSIQVPCAEQQI